jgi:hypothetical protein
MRAALAIALTLFTLPALAEDKVACRKAFEQAQSLRDEGKLTAAREQMVICTNTCPKGFQKICEGWIGDVEKALPSIVLRVTDANGGDLVDATVTLDGKPIAIDGKAIELDPGKHLLHVEPGKIDKEIVVAQGEKNRSIVIALEAPKKKEEEPKPLPPSRPAPQPERLPIAAIIVTSAGVAALGGFAYFGLKGDSDHRALVDGCSKTASCTQDDKDRVKREWLVADIFLASGAVLVGVGAVLFFTHDSKPTTTVGFAPTRGGANASISIAF